MEYGQQMQLQQREGSLLHVGPQWLSQPTFKSPLLKNLVANHFGAMVPTHLY
jgi:hypothetical protein